METYIFPKAELKNVRRYEMEKLRWRTEKRRVKDLHLFEGNPRKMSEAQAEQLLKSLTKFGLVEIPAIDQNNRVLAGNMRVQALRKLGKDNTEIDVRVPDRDLTEEEAREYLLRSNRNVGEFNLDLLANFEEDLLLDVGWEQDELMELFSLNSVENVEVNEEDLMVITVEAPEAPRLKERMAFYCENMDEYNKIKRYFKKGTSELDKNKLLKML